MMNRIELALAALAATAVGLGAAAYQGAADAKTVAFAKPAADNMTLTAVEGIKVGHHTLAERPTGCTTILFKDGTTGSVDVRGGAPGTRETDLLEPVNNVQIVNAISLSGGSAFGLDAASGVVKWLEERNIGYPVGAAGVVPIVPAAILFDLGFGGSPKVRPGPDCGYRAAAAATEGPVQEGNVGAGAGATVGKSGGRGGGGGPMKAGIGSAAIRLPNGLVVAALVAVNAVGDIIDPWTGQVVAGARGADGKLIDARKMLRGGGAREGRAMENTTIGLVATNATLSKVHAQKMAQMAHDGFARAISPVHTPGDGDSIFAVATGTWDGTASYGQVGALAAEATAQRPAGRNLTLTAVEGITVGHFTMPGRPTGCTVILAPAGTIGSVDVRGASPGTRETALLHPASDVQVVNAIVLAGGSAYGLNAASGVVKWLDERGVGYPVGAAGVVPIVPSAILIDLWFGGNPAIRPDAECGYRAASAASAQPVQEGNIGAGAGATVGKTAGVIASGRGGPMKAGIGSAAITHANGLVVAAMVAVNAAGDIIDPATGRVLAGVRGPDGTLADARRRLRNGTGASGRAGENTTIGIVATNARLTKVEAQKVAQMAHDGYARAISPIHTLADGDTVFSLATGAWTGRASHGTIGALAAEVMADAVVRAATQAAASHGLPSARDLGTIRNW